MKEYNHKTRLWEEKKEKVGSLKKPETCKGKKPHEFVLVLPKYIRRERLLNSEEIVEYYKIEDEKIASDRVFENRLEKIGVRHYRYSGLTVRYYLCAKCGKEKYE